MAFQTTIVKQFSSCKKIFFFQAEAKKAGIGTGSVFRILAESGSV